MPGPSPVGKPTAWQSFSRSSGGSQQKDYKSISRTTSKDRSPHRRNSGSKHSRKFSRSPIRKFSAHASFTTQHGKYLAFYGSVLSNFHTGEPFAGSDAMPYLLEQLTDLKIPHPAHDSLAVKIMADHHFICGEQFMMACKGFLFELPRIHTVSAPSDIVLHDYQQDIIAQAFRRFNNPYNDTIQHDTATLRNSTFLKVLDSHSPGQIKALGRQTPNFNNDTWTRASKAIVIAACLARAEADPQLSSIYQAEWDTKQNKQRHYFVEASPNDNTWGVGLSREDKRIADPKSWQGQNRLGECHDEACRMYNEKRRPNKQAKEEQLREQQEPVKQINKNEQLPDNENNDNDKEDKKVVNEEDKAVNEDNKAVNGDQKGVKKDK